MAEEAKPKKKVKASSIVDAVLGVLVVVLLCLEINLVVTQRRDGIPSLFGTTFMRVLTGSMDGPDTSELYLTREGDVESGRVTGVYETVDEAKKASGADETYFVLEKKGPHKLSTGTGAVLTKISFDEVEAGDVVTFLYDIKVGGTDYGNYPVSHRVIEIGEENGQKTLYCYGDAYPSHGIGYSSTNSSYEGVQHIHESEFLGVVTSSNDFLGWCLGVAQSPYFLPVAIFVPLGVMGIVSVIEMIVASNKARKEEDQKVKEMVAAMGVDPHDEKAYDAAYELCSTKLEIKEEMEAEKAKQKEKYQEEYEKEKKRLKKDKAFQQEKEKEKERLRKEMAKEKKQEGEGK